jgi:hypothetical protein
VLDRHDACALHAGYIRLQTYTENTKHLKSFFNARVVKRMPLNVTLHVHCLSCLSSVSVSPARVQNLRRFPPNLVLPKNKKELFGCTLKRGAMQKKIVFINCNWAVTRWQWLFYIYAH